MTETFLILLAGGVLLAAAVSDPEAVTLLWLRLCGIIALALAALAIFFFVRRQSEATAFFRRVEWAEMMGMALAVLLQLAFVQVAFRKIQRLFAGTAFVLGALAGTALVHDLMIGRGTAVAFAPKILAISLQCLSCAGVSAMTGLVLMDMLLGHAYLTASRMTMAPFRRLNLALAGVLVFRVICAVGMVIFFQSRKPVEMLVGIYGLLIGTRYFVGLLIPAIFTYMAHDCIKRRSTQAATGILYVNGLLVFIGELIALHLLRDGIAVLRLAMAEDRYITQCPQCGCKDLFVRKDFPQKIGLGLVAASALSFLVLAANPRTFWIGAMILAGAAAIDGVLYLFVGKVTVCYRCRQEVRGVPINPAHGGFELAVGEKYRHP